MGVFDFVKSAAGLTEKAVIIVGDSSDVKIEEVKAQKPSAGAGAGVPSASMKVPDFNTSLVEGFLSTDDQRNSKDKKFEAVGSVKKYRFEVQFNPAEITISGYGGERLPTQSFANIPVPNPGEGQKQNQQHKPPGGRPRIGSRVAAADTRITMHFRVVFDKTPAQNMIANNKAVKAVKAIAGIDSGSVQDEVEALHAIARDDKKRLAMFIWGDMIYEGIINGIDSEYVMFKPNGQPIRANVNISMLLYAEHDLGKNVDIWRHEYDRDFYSLKKSPAKGRIHF